MRLLALLVALAACAGSALAQNVEAGRAKAATCQACHGPNGNSPSPQFPILAGQTARYLYLQLRDFKEGRRDPGVMLPFVKDLTREDMLDLAAFFAAQPLLDTRFKVDPAKAERGRKKADETLCTMCHLGGFKGQNEVPRVAGQHHDYIVKQLQDFKAGARTNDAGTMSSVSKTLNAQDIDDLAHFVADLH
ncbi:MAG TPA: c-type cytochrome [Albitalea sp.]|jgi:cytochrome c553|nr:c-type cytochrome [Albitalea sp.]